MLHTQRREVAGRQRHCSFKSEGDRLVCLRRSVEQIALNLSKRSGISFFCLTQLA
ncbi:Uncharacterised protein [Vibrio cholerae]|nr:Uncharacterised protein [Vibrio cholerae]